MPASAAPGTAPSPAIEAAARAHFVAGIEHYRARRYRDAIRELQVSRSLVPNPEIWFNVGRAHEQLGELQLAIDHYQSYLRDRPDAKDAGEVRARITGLEQRIEAARAASALAAGPRAGSLVLEVTPPAALVRIDGTRVDGAAAGRVLAVQPGSHSVEAELAEHAPFRARVDVAPGSLRAAYVDLQPATPQVDLDRGRTYVWIAAGVTGAALVTSGVLAVASAIERDGEDASGARGLERASEVALASALGFAVVTLVLDIAGGAAHAP